MQWVLRLSYQVLKRLHTGCQLCLWPVLLYPLIGLCESPSPLLHEVCYHYSWRSATDLIFQQNVIEGTPYRYADKRHDLQPQGEAASPTSSPAV